MRHTIRSAAAVLAVAAGVYAGAAAADLKMAYIDPLSGGAASAGILGQKHMQFFVDKINAAGGVNGEKITLLIYDNKVSPQESLIVLKKAVDEGATVSLDDYAFPDWQPRTDWTKEMYEN